VKTLQRTTTQEGCMAKYILEIYSWKFVLLIHTSLEFSRKIESFCKLTKLLRMSRVTYGVATIKRLLKNIGFFCKRALYKRLYSAGNFCACHELNCTVKTLQRTTTHCNKEGCFVAMNIFCHASFFVAMSCSARVVVRCSVSLQQRRMLCCNEL